MIQAAAGLWLAAADWTMPFSANRRAAEWIAAGDFGEYVLAGSEAHAASGVGMHLARPIYYLNRECWGTFIIRNNHRRQFASPAELFESAATLSGESSKPVLLILNRKLPGQKGFRLRAGFRNSLIADERFFLYTYEPAGASPPASRERGTVSEAPSQRRPG
jgi:hypothetical protein